MSEGANHPEWVEVSRETVEAMIERLEQRTRDFDWNVRDALYAMLGERVKLRAVEHQRDDLRAALDKIYRCLRAYRNEPNSVAEAWRIAESALAHTPDSDVPAYPEEAE